MIVINARFLTQTLTGVQRYAIEICKELPSSIGDEEVVFVCPNSKKINRLNKNSKIIEIGKFKNNLWEQIDLPFFLKKNGNPLLINLVGIGPVFYKNKIFTLYDLAFYHHPEWFSLFFQKVYNLLIPISLNYSKHIVTDSEYVKEDIHTTYNVKRDNIKVIYAATDDKFKNLNITREKNILTVSSIDPRKNLSRIIKAFKLLNTDYKLIIVGKKNSSFANLELVEEENTNIIFTGYLSDEALVQLYNKSEIFIYASLFEGFGIPPLEAQACGCSCIVSEATCLPEIYKNSVLYCNPMDEVSISKAMEILIKDYDKRQKLQQAGFENVKRFSWDSSTLQLEKLIETYI